MAVSTQLLGAILKRYATDVAIGIVFLVGVFGYSISVQRHLDPILYEYTVKTAAGVELTTFNIWFDGDAPKQKLVLTDRYTDKPGFTEKHPLYAFAAYYAVFPLKVLGVEPLTRIQLYVAATASFWAALLFALLRVVTGRRLDAVILTAMGILSASSMFWTIVPDTFLLGSATILAALLLSAAREARPVSSTAIVLVSAATLSITVTNWMVGMLATFVREHWRRAVQLSVNAFFVVTILWGVQKIFVPSAQFFLAQSADQAQWILHSSSGGPLRVLASFFLHTMVMPSFDIASTQQPLWYGMVTQAALPGSASGLGLVAVAAWIALLGLGAYSLYAAREYSILRTVLAVAILGQLFLHTLFGRETFLYSMHWLPLLVAAVAFGARTRYRNAMLGLALVVSVTCGINNSVQRAKAVRVVDQIAALTTSDEPPRFDDGKRRLSAAE